MGLIIQRNMSDESITSKEDKCQVGLEDLLKIDINRLNVSNTYFYDGAIAQELESVCPQAVSVVNGKKTVDYSMVVPPLLKAFQDFVKAKNEEVENIKSDLLLIIEHIAKKSSRKTILSSKDIKVLNNAQWR